ncbi:hypothetical protein Y032_0071g567 [Ancylostoma ceylanicum]|uniref:Transcription initiation factor TFIID subunit n=1 Tax=Ancylostoma ceylanicum TaxID=53326 RepID=A0A016TW48_9BILA|nr:hypothetical protein Y032_0071g567 [Ancylostoma ceylanicum]
MADDHYMAENGVGNNAQYHDYHHHQQIPQRNVINRPGLQNEPSVSIVRDDIQRPLSTLQQNLIQGNLQEPSNINMRDFINELEDYVPTIPDAVTTHFMRACGCDCSDPRIVRLVALATQKYVSDIILDAMQQVSNSVCHITILAVMLQIIPGQNEGPRANKEGYEGNEVVA